jgi:hypothetical protein
MPTPSLQPVLWMLAIAGVTAPGCMIMKVEARNPIPEMSRIAIVPFFNLTQEPAEVVDGRRFALAYFSELQKTPGFEVVPVGVVETAILEHQIPMSGPDDALQLARILNVDAVVIGAVTDFHPYYPPRIGLQVDWYSPYAWEPVPVPSRTRHVDRTTPASGPPPADSSTVRAQSPEPWNSSSGLVELGIPQDEGPRGPWPVEQAGAGPSRSPSVFSAANAPPRPTPVPVDPDDPFDPRQPLMSYTRLFDGADQDLVNRLRDYLELRGDRRSGGWEAHLHRSEDFIRFTTHLMILEMLSLHGGATKSRIVFKWRRYR